MKKEKYKFGKEIRINGIFIQSTSSNLHGDLHSRILTNKRDI